MRCNGDLTKSYLRFQNTSSPELVFLFIPMKSIIFDFNRTLYDPAKGTLISGAKSVLRNLGRRGYDMYLLSITTPSRSAVIDSLGISSYFKKIALVERKTKKNLREFLGKEIFSGPTWIVGDRVRSEIGLGKAMGFRTIWFRQGKFANELPRSPEEVPDHTVNSLYEILKIVL